MTPALLPAALLLLVICALIFGGLGKLFACNRDAPVFFSRAILLDYAYCSLGVAYVALVPACVALVATSFFPGSHAVAPAAIHTDYGWLSRLPLAVQIAVLLLATDFVQYWFHRGFHHRGWLWEIHAVHHGAQEVNWTTAFRVHPLNYLVSNILLAIVARLLGFSPATFLFAAPLSVLSNMLAHANLNWTFGPLRHGLVSPVFHRWHHTLAEDSRDANFGTMFAIWDVAFGTYQMPRGCLPETYGAEGVPRGMFGQLLHPFRLVR
jgi:sterol desaturase/sphingolipid hydroxylase (fatty acid hydroxylase superfamily)